MTFEFPAQCPRRNTRLKIRNFHKKSGIVLLRHFMVLSCQYFHRGEFMQAVPASELNFRGISCHIWFGARAWEALKRLRGQLTKFYEKTFCEKNPLDTWNRRSNCLMKTAVGFSNVTRFVKECRGAELKSPLWYFPFILFHRVLSHSLFF